MPKYIEQDIRALNSKYVVLPVWKGGEAAVPRLLTHPDVYAVDSSQQYPVGTKFVDGDRVFHYGYCHKVVTARAMGGMMNSALHKSTTTDAVAHIIGETEIVISDTASTLNLWAGGYYMPRVHPYSSYRVLSSTATASSKVTLTLERGLLVEIPASDASGFLNQNMYSKMESHLPNGGLYYASAVGVNLVLAVASQWMWVQTWGPCYIHGGDELLGKDAGDRMGFFHIDGSLVCPATVEQWNQEAGYAINMTDASTSTWYVFLRLAC